MMALTEIQSDFEMIHPTVNLLTDEFEQIKNHAQAYCISAMGAKLIQESKPTDSYENMMLLLNKTSDWKNIIDNGEPFVADGFEDISRELNILRIENAVLSAEQFIKILTLVHTTKRILFFYNEKQIMYPNAALTAANITYEKQISLLIENVFDNFGVVKSSASIELASIRKTLQRKRSETDKIYNQLIAKYKKNGWVSEFDESTRNGRRVISINAEQKRSLQGIVHDISATGKTAYIEPEEVVEINNIVLQLELEERQEILRILRDLTQQMRQYSTALTQYYNLISETDFLRAKALFAIHIKACKPLVSSNPFVDLKNAKHPLLVLQHNKSGKKTVPFSLLLNTQNRILVISGPNAGGKTVCMKATALLQIMLQAGFLICADDNSVCGFFSNFLIDIGDSQSLAYELSTYASRLQKMKTFLQVAGPKSLFIIDEFGTGTDPELGGALAESILVALNQKKSFGLITTHFLNLKVQADRTPGLLNGSMLFDQIKLEPMFELIVGKPGSSYTFVVAERSGLPKKVIDNARNKVSKNHVLLENLLQQVEHDKSLIESKLKQIEKAEKQLNDLLEKYEILRQQNENSKTKFDEKIKKTELRLINEFDNRLLKFVNEWNHSKSKKAVLEKYKKIYDKQRNQNQKVINENEINIQNAFVAQLKPGMWVQLKGGKTQGLIEQLHGNKAHIVFGIFKTIADVMQLMPTEPREPREPKTKSKTIKNQDKKTDKHQ
jgi:DNA mismatch repair protein MutS2